MRPGALRATQRILVGLCSVVLVNPVEAPVQDKAAPGATDRRSLSRIIIMVISYVVLRPGDENLFADWTDARDSAARDVPAVNEFPVDCAVHFQTFISNDRQLS